MKRRVFHPHCPRSCVKPAKSHFLRLSHLGIRPRRIIEGVCLEHFFHQALCLLVHWRPHSGVIFCVRSVEQNRGKVDLTICDLHAVAPAQKQKHSMLLATSVAFTARLALEQRSPVLDVLIAHPENLQELRICPSRLGLFQGLGVVAGSDAMPCRLRRNKSQHHQHHCPPSTREAHSYQKSARSGPRARELRQFPPWWNYNDQDSRNLHFQVQN